LDIDYEYRQDSNLYYLTGLTQDETMLVLMPGNAGRREILFIKERNPVREHWTGRRLTTDEATARSGIATVLYAAQFELFMAGVRAARPGAYEYEVKAGIEAVHRSRGAASWSYPSIVGSGPNATILHYPGGDRQMQAGDLLLVDAACNYEYASGDITRTYPV